MDAPIGFRPSPGELWKTAWVPAPLWARVCGFDQGACRGVRFGPGEGVKVGRLRFWPGGGPFECRGDYF